MNKNEAGDSDAQHLRDRGFNVIKGTKGSKVNVGKQAERLADTLGNDRPILDDEAARQTSLGASAR